MKKLNVFFKQESYYNLAVLFNIYDIDQDGYIGEEELYTMMQLMVGDDLNDG